MNLGAVFVIANFDNLILLITFAYRYENVNFHMETDKSNIISRLRFFMERKQLSSSQFADAAQIPRPTLSQLLNGRRNQGDGAKKISSDLIRKIHDTFPELNVMWLLFGDGEMESISNIESSEPKDGLFSSLSDDEDVVNQSTEGDILFADEFTESGSEKSKLVDLTGERAQRPSQPSLGSENQADIHDFAKSSAYTLNADRSKSIQSIMVFYTDNSFEIFKPSNAGE